MKCSVLKVDSVLVGNWGSKSESRERGWGSDVLWSNEGTSGSLHLHGGQYSCARKEAVDQSKSIKTWITLGLNIEDNVGKPRAVNALGTVV